MIKQFPDSIFKWVSSYQANQTTNANKVSSSQLHGMFHGVETLEHFSCKRKMFEYKYISTLNVCELKQEARGKFGEHERWKERKSLNFLRASYLDERIANVWTNCFTTFSTRWKIFFSRDMFADVMSVHNRNMKHAREIEFD